MDIWQKLWHCPYCGSEVRRVIVWSDTLADLHCQSCGTRVAVVLISTKEKS